MKAVVKKKHPLLSKQHQHEWLNFAIAHQDWKHVIWSDETKINYLGSDGRKWVWKRAGEGLSSRLVQGTVSIWLTGSQNIGQTSQLIQTLQQFCWSLYVPLYWIKLWKCSLFPRRMEKSKWYKIIDILILKLLRTITCSP